MSHSKSFKSSQVQDPKDSPLGKAQLIWTIFVAIAVALVVLQQFLSAPSTEGIETGNKFPAVKIQNRSLASPPSSSLP